MSDANRRDFLMASGKLLAGTVALGSLGAYASEHEHPMHAGSGDGAEIDASAEDTCATCQFWGGMRKVSEDKSKITAQSMGWCNNPDSPNHQKLTAADHRMKKPGIWEKWAVL